MKNEITILLCNHFDLVWRRCFERTVEYEEGQLISYGEIQKFYIKRCLMMCDQDDSFCFNIESVAVLRRFLEVCPEEEKRIKSYIKKGRIDIPFTGDNIVDGNLIRGESLVRNFLYGSRTMKERFGHESRSAYRRDAFGNSAQLPQILKQFGIDWVWGLSYTEPEGTVWKGLDGTKICCMEPPFFAESGSIDKYAPCPVCRGTGERDGNNCSACEGKGINWKDSRFALPLPEVPAETAPYSVWGQRSEELIPPFEMLEWPEVMQNKLGNDTDVHFGTFSEIHNKMQDIIRKQMQESAVCGPELNPNNSGVYVSRNRLKKLCRECESRMEELEHLLSAAALKGMKYPYGKVEKIWHKMFFLMFHDAVTGTVVDTAYEELLNTAAQAGRQIDRLFAKAAAFLTGDIPASEKEARYTILNPGLTPVRGMMEAVLPLHAGYCDFVTDSKEKLVRTKWRKKGDNASVSLLLPPIGPMESLTVTCVPEEPSSPEEEPIGAETSSEEEQPQQGPENPWELENGRYRIRLDDRGIVWILDKETGWKQEGQNGLRVHELVLESDVGSPWTTLGTTDSGEKLSGRTKRVETQKNEVYERAIFQVAPFNTNTVEGVELVWSVTLVKGSAQIDFRTSVEYWDTYNQRIRAVFPTGIKGKHLFEIPYGVLERKPYEKKMGKWDAATGDWPAVNWAGISTRQRSLAVLNQGIPSYGVEKGAEGDILSLSLLRSPCIPTYLHEPRSYNMRRFDGMRDSGKHVFSYSLVCYGGSLTDSSVVEDGEAFQVKPRMLPGKMALPAVPVIESRNIRIGACYTDQDGCLYVRLAEYRGEKGLARVKAPGAKRIVRCLLSGCELKDAATGEEITVILSPFEITTLRCEV